MRLLTVFTVLAVALGHDLLSRQNPSVSPTPPSAPNIPSVLKKSCTLKPLGQGHDDTPQILSAISKCGTNGKTTFLPGQYNITSKMTWNLNKAVVDMDGAWLNFNPNVTYWLDPDNTYRVIFIQNQASWFVLSGEDFEVNAFNNGGIQGNGQIWWNHYSNMAKLDGDGRPVSLSVVQAQRALIKDFRIEAQPFWCNAVSNSTDITYDGMFCNATNTNPAFFGTNLVPNTDGIDTYRSDRILLQNWDITCGDDCLAIKGNSTNVHIDGVICRGGNGVAFGSLGQYVQFNDYVENVLLENVQNLRLDPQIQPGMKNGVYFKSWDGTANGVPPTGGGGASGLVTNVLIRNVSLDRVDLPLHLYQTNGGKSGDAVSTLQFQNITFEDWSGTSTGTTVVDLQCSPAVPCPNIGFDSFKVVANGTAAFICVNVLSETGLPFCTTSGKASS